MSSKSWYQQFKEARFLTVNDERSFFCPFGPFKGYLLQSSLVDRVARALFWWFLISNTCAFVAIPVVRFVLNVDIPIAIAVVGAAHRLLTVVLVRRFTRDLQSLPFGVSMRTTAALGDEEQWWRQCSGLLMLSMLATMFAIVGQQQIQWIVSTLFITSYALLPASLIYLRHQLDAKALAEDHSVA